MSYVLALDVGTSLVKCQIIDKNGERVGFANQEVVILYPKPGYVEINPNHLWSIIVLTINDAIKNSKVDKTKIECMGISTQRCTFITWNRITGKPYHNFITWKDIRANDLVNQLNNSLQIKILRFCSKIAYSTTGYNRFLAGSKLKFFNSQVAVRLKWMIENINNLKEAIDKNEVLYGTVDTWLINRLTNGTNFVTDVSCASPTGLFDPFTLKWAGWALGILKISEKILPDIVDTAGNNQFGIVDSSIFGIAIPITASVADQSASVFGSKCFNIGDLKITLGTGTFLDVNTGSIAHASFEGVYPVIGWKIQDEIIYLAEISSNDTGALTRWAIDSGLTTDISNSADIALSVNDNCGVYFVPAFNGIQAPINDVNAGSGFIGISPLTRKPHMLRAIFESIAFRVLQLYLIFKNEIIMTPTVIKVDGGVSKNNFITQLLSDLINLPLERTETAEMSVLGAAYLSGIAYGIWHSKDDIFKFEQITKTFKPIKKKNLNNNTYEIWCDAVNRFCGWYRN